MAQARATALPVEHDFQALCDGLEGLSDRNRLLALAKLALLLCHLIPDKAAVTDAIRRAKLDLDGLKENQCRTLFTR